jgi:hypothetical protein
MGSAPFIRPGQMNTSIFIELGNGDNFMFDLGVGSVANYIAAGLALNQLDKIFLTHLRPILARIPRLGTSSSWGDVAGTQRLVASRVRRRAGHAPASACRREREGTGDGTPLQGQDLGRHP